MRNLQEVPISKKVALTVEEAAAYTSIGRDRLYEITNDPACDFVMWVGKKRLIKRKLFEEYLDNSRSI